MGDHEVIEGRSWRDLLEEYTGGTYWRSLEGDHGGHLPVNSNQDEGKYK